MKSPSRKPNADDSASVRPRALVGARHLWGYPREFGQFSYLSHRKVTDSECRVSPGPLMWFAIFRCKDVKCRDSSSSASMMTPIRPDEVKNSCLGQSM